MTQLNATSSDRNDCITIAKAIAIILMVLAHAGFFHDGAKFINMFHMPMFFFCSGFCFKEKYLTNFKSFFLRKVRGIWWPFVKYGLIFLLFHNVFFRLNIYNSSFSFRGVSQHLLSPSEILLNFFNLVHFGNVEQLLGGFWFLRTLFYASIISFFVIKYLFNRSVVLTIFILSFAVILLTYLHLKVPFFNIGYLDVLASAFFVTGYAFSKHKLVYAYPLMKIVIMFLIVYISALFIPMSMLKMPRWGGGIYFIIAMVGSIMVMSISSKLNSLQCAGKKFLIFVGNHTLDILVWHFLSFKLVNLFVIVIEKKSMNLLACFPVIPDSFEGFYYTSWWPLYFLIGLAFPIIYALLKEILIKKKKQRSNP